LANGLPEPGPTDQALIVVQTQTLIRLCYCNWPVNFTAVDLGFTA